MGRGKSKGWPKQKGTWREAEAASVTPPAGNRSPPPQGVTETSSVQGLLTRCSQELRENQKGMVDAAPRSW